MKFYYIINSKVKKYIFWIFVVVMIIFLDQLSKIMVHFFMAYGQEGEIPILGKWLRIHYTLNPGMAFGIRIGTKYGKLFLTSFRIFATVLIGSHLPKLIKDKKVSILVILGWSMIFAGAIGNIIDSVFYGIIFDNAPINSPMKLFYGQVIDMILVGIENIYIPSFIPFIGGRYLPHFPVFNIADSSICMGVSCIIFDNILGRFNIFQKT